MEMVRLSILWSVSIWHLDYLNHDPLFGVTDYLAQFEGKNERTGLGSFLNAPEFAFLNGRSVSIALSGCEWSGLGLNTLSFLQLVQKNYVSHSPYDAL